MRRMRELGLKPAVRIDASGSEFLSDNGNLVMDCGTSAFEAPARLERELLAIPGVVGTGLFIGIASVVLIANGDGSITTLERRR
jgi:ribose 5-phosphate isomerase A